MPSSDFAEIHDYPYWFINSRWCRLLCDSSGYTFFFSCTLPSSVLMVYLLFIEQDVGTHFYITESHSIYAFSSLFIMLIYHETKCIKDTFIYIIRCNKGHSFFICCIALHWLKFFGAASDKIGLWDLNSLALWKLCWKSLCQKYCFLLFISVKNLKHGVMHNSFLHVPYQIPVHLFGIFFPIYQTMIHYKQSKVCLVFSYFHQFLELVDGDANAWALALCLVCHFVHYDIKLVVFSVNNSQTPL